MSKRKFKLHIDFKKLGRRILKGTIILFVILLILEVSYRYQWIDFFQPEFKALNKDIDPKKKNVLIFGDSFTAHPNSYVTHLRKQHPNYNFINAAVPGTGPIEMSLMAKRRIEAYPPDIVIYQMYMGNDLVDIDPVTNWGAISFSRNTYWSLKPSFQIFGLLSRRLNGSLADFDKSKKTQTEVEFNTKKYSPRTKMLISASSNYVNEGICNKSTFQDAKECCFEKIQYLKSLLPSKTKLYVVVIPHFSQVNSTYQKQYLQLGAGKTSLQTEYPFVKSMRKKLKGVRILNPLKFIRKQEESGGEMYFHNDPHLTDEGQLLLTAYINSKMENK